MPCLIAGSKRSIAQPTYYNPLLLLSNIMSDSIECVQPAAHKSIKLH